MHREESPGAHSAAVVLTQVGDLNAEIQELSAAFAEATEVPPKAETQKLQVSVRFG